MNLLPLPIPLGFDKSSIVNQPTKLYVTSGSFQHPATILDGFGRELVSWYSESALFGDKLVFITPSRRHLFTMRSRRWSAASKLIIGLPKRYFLEDSDGREIASIEPIDVNRIGRTHTIWFRNLVDGGEGVQIHLRGRWNDPTPALMLGQVPVAIIARHYSLNTNVPWWWGAVRRQERDYEVLVAPGADLVWIASIISILEMLPR